VFLRIDILFNFVSLYVFLINTFQGAYFNISVVRDGRCPNCNVWSNFEHVISRCCLQSVLACYCCLYSPVICNLFGIMSLMKRVCTEILVGVIITNGGKRKKNFYPLYM
jgi:hypothetical protein